MLQEGKVDAHAARRGLLLVNVAVVFGDTEIALTKQNSPRFFIVYTPTED